jgi:hypothetical protein
MSRGGGAGSGPDKECGPSQTPELGVPGGGRELLPGGPAVLAIEVESGTWLGRLVRAPLPSTRSLCPHPNSPSLSRASIPSIMRHCVVLYLHICAGSFPASEILVEGSDWHQIHCGAMPRLHPSQQNPS